MRMDINARLEHAFTLAYEHLGIEKLLDPEGNFSSKISAFILYIQYMK